MLERKLEQWAVRYTRERGGWLLKWNCPGHRGVPDRILVTMYGQVKFVEFKSPTGKLSELQKIWQGRLPNVHVVRNKQEFEELF